MPAMVPPKASADKLDQAMLKQLRALLKGTARGKSNAREGGARKAWRALERLPKLKRSTATARAQN